MITVTCESAGCGNLGVAVEVEPPDVGPDGAPAPWAVVCGPCGAVLASSAP